MMPKTFRIAIYGYVTTMLEVVDHESISIPVRQVEHGKASSLFCEIH
jgi:hypothetical protein